MFGDEHNPVAHIRHHQNGGMASRRSPVEACYQDFTVGVVGRLWGARHIPNLGAGFLGWFHV